MDRVIIQRPCVDGVRDILEPLLARWPPPVAASEVVPLFILASLCSVESDLNVGELCMELDSIEREALVQICLFRNMVSPWTLRLRVTSGPSYPQVSLDFSLSLSGQYHT